MTTKKAGPAMVIAATVMMLFLGILYAWSIFRVEISAVFPEFDAAQMSLNFTFLMIFFCLGGFVGGKIASRRSHSCAMRIAAVLLFVGYFGVSFMGSLEGRAALTLMYICYGVISGLGTGVGYNACVTGVSPWFPERSGLVSGVMLMGFGLGSLLIGLLAQWISDVSSVFVAFRIFAAAILLVLLAGSFFLKKPVSPASPAGTQADDGKSLTPARMLMTASFWVYFIWNVIMSSSGLLIINSSANIPVYYGAAAGLGLGVSVFNGCGRPVTGMIMDRLGQFKGMLVTNSVLIAAGLLLLLTSFTGNVITMCIGMFAVGVCYGSGVTISAKVIAELYGLKHYSVNFSLAQFCSIPASFIGPYISGLLQVHSGGDYRSTFVMLVLLSLISMAVIFILRLCIKREARRSA